VEILQIPTREPNEQPIANRESGSDRVLMKYEAYRRLKSLIQDGSLAGDSTISERELSQQLGMSKTPIRAALEILETQGLVSVSPQKGIFVREISAREIAELFDVRFAIEPFVVKRLARTTPNREQLGCLARNLDEQRMAANKSDPIRATELDIAFHHLLTSMLDNRELLHLLERCFDRLYRSILHVNRSMSDRLLQSVHEHEDIANSIQSGDFLKSATLMENHLKFGRRFLLGGGDDL
jgi:DNA-binding GntR family transcriptional regulator